jgi:hypothetical protein
MFDVKLLDPDFLLIDDYQGYRLYSKSASCTTSCTAGSFFAGLTFTIPFSNPEPPPPPKSTLIPTTGIMVVPSKCNGAPIAIFAVTTFSI